MADGYGFGAEGDWKTAALVRVVKVMGDRPRRRHLVHGGLHVPPRRRPARRCSARTCSRSARRSPPAGRPARSTRSRSAAGPIRSGSCSRRAPGPAVVVGAARPRRPLPAGRERGRASSSRTRSCRGCRSRARCGGRSPTSPTAPRRGSSPAARTTRVLTGRSAPRRRRPRGDRRASSCSSSTSTTRIRDVEQGAALEPGLLPPRPRAVSVPARRAPRAVARGEPGDRPRRARRAHVRERQRGRPRRGRHGDQAERRPYDELTPGRDRRRRPRERRGRRRRVRPSSDTPTHLVLYRALRGSAASSTRTRRPRRRGRRPARRSPASGRRTPTTSAAPCRSRGR